MKMVTYFNAKDMVSFGKYLLSDERIELYKNHPDAENLPPLEERLKAVSHADFENWKHALDGMSNGPVEKRKDGKIEYKVCCRTTNKTIFAPNNAWEVVIKGVRSYIQLSEFEFTLILEKEMDPLASAYNALKGSVGIKILQIIALNG